MFIALLILIGLLPIVAVWLLYRKGWLTSERRRKFLLALMTLEAIGSIALVISSHKIPHLDKFALGAFLVAMWTAAKKGQDNQNLTLLAALMGYSAFLMLLARL